MIISSLAAVCEYVFRTDIFELWSFNLKTFSTHSVYLPIDLSINDWPTCLTVCLSVCQSVFVSISPFDFNLHTLSFKFFLQLYSIVKWEKKLKSMWKLRKKRLLFNCINNKKKESTFYKFHTWQNHTVSTKRCSSSQWLNSIFG